MSSITSVINDHFEVTEDRKEVTDHIADFIRQGVKNGDAEALVIFLTPAIQNWVNNCHATFTRNIRIAAAERVDGFGGPTTYTLPATSETREVLHKGLLDTSVMANTYTIGHLSVSVGDMTIEQHRHMADMYQKQADTIIERRVNLHREAIRVLTETGALCLHELV